MTDIQYLYLDDAVERIVEAWEEMTIPASPPRLKKSLKVVQAAQKFLLPVPTAFPCVMLYPGGLTAGDAGEPYDEQAITVISRFLIGKVQSNLKGENQKLLWLFIPYAVNWFNAHSDLSWKTGQADLWLIPGGAFVTSVTRNGLFRDDPEHVGFELSHTLKFNIENEEAIWLGV